jgi:DnaK suppressor protein
MATKKASPKAKKPVTKTAPKKVAAVKKPEPVKKAVAAAKPAPKAAVKPVAKPAPAPKPAAKPAETVKPPAAKPVVAKPVQAEPKLTKPVAPQPPKAPSKPISATSIVRPVTVSTLSRRDDDGQGGEADEEGPDSRGVSLLSGPRNVKPYIPRRGEQYMNKEQLDHFRTILDTWKRDLMHEVDRTMLHMKDEAANFPDPNDRATQESEFSLELRTRDRERKLIRKIDEAVSRIDDGSYGYCVETGEEIGIKRLEARPVATLCVEAQERRERREKQYGDRDDRYR